MSKLSAAATRFIFFYAFVAISFGNCRSSRAQSDLAWEPGAIRLYGFGAKRDDFTVDELKAMGVNIATCGLSYNLGTISRIDHLRDDQSLREEIDALRRAGITVASRTALIGVPWEQFFVEFPDAKKHVVLAADGTPQLWKRRPQTYIANLIDPYWLDIHSMGIRYLTEMGAEYVHLDNPHTFISYDARTQKMWRDFVTKRLTTAVGDRSIGSVGRELDLTIDDDLVGHIPVLLEEAADRSDPVVVANRDVFRYEQFVAFLEKLKDHSDRAGGVKLSFTGHMDPRSFYYWTEARNAYDVVTIENSTASPYWFAPEGQALFGFMVAYACSGGKPARIKNKLLRRHEDPVWIENRYYGSQWHTPARDRHELYMAEAAAMGGWVAPVTPVVAYVRKFGKRYENYPETVKRYYSFQRDQQYYYTDTASPARIALLLSHLSYIYDPDLFERAMFGLAEMLLKRHVPFDVIMVENNDRLNLDQYDTLLANHLAVLDNAVVEKIQMRVASGARLVVVGQFATRKAESFQPRPEPLLSPASKPVVLGKGKVVRAQSDATDLYQRFTQPYTQASAEKLLALLDIDRTRLHLASETGEESLIAVVVREKPNHWILHCLNYNFHLLGEGTEEERLGKERVIPQEGVRIAVPKQLIPRVTRATLHFPGAVSRSLEIRETEHSISFHIPRLHVYAMITCEK